MVRSKIVTWLGVWCGLFMTAGNLQAADAKESKTVGGAQPTLLTGEFPPKLFAEQTIRYKLSPEIDRKRLHLTGAYPSMEAVELSADGILTVTPRRFELGPHKIVVHNNHGNVNFKTEVVPDETKAKAEPAFPSTLIAEQTIHYTLPDDIDRKRLRLMGAYPKMDDVSLSADGVLSITPHRHELGSHKILIDHSRGTIDLKMEVVSADAAASGEKPARVAKTTRHGANPDKSAQSGPATDHQPPSTATSGPFPSKWIADKTLVYLLPPERSRKGMHLIGIFPKMSEASLSADGTLTLTPSRTELGDHKILINTSAGHFEMHLTVVDPAESASPEDVKAQPPGEIALTAAETGLSYGLNAGSVVLVQGTRLYILDQDGMAVKRTNTLEHTYRAMFERSNYFVGLAAKSIDLLDKKSLAIIRRIPLEYPRVDALVVHPRKAVSYVSVLDSSQGNKMGAAKVAIVDETTGNVKADAQAVGDWLAVDPTGQHLFAGVKELFKTGRHYDLNSGMLLDDFGTHDLLVGYDIADGSLRQNGRNEHPGQNGTRVIASPDGRLCAYVSGGGSEGQPYSIAAFKGGDVSKELVRYQIEAYPHDLCFHPTLDVVAATNGSKIWFFDRESGEVQADRIEHASPLSSIDRLMFSPSGRNLMVIANEAKRGRVLLSLPLKLSAADSAALAKLPHIVAPELPAAESPGNDNPFAPPESHPRTARTWSDSSGKFKIEATLVEVRDNVAALRKADGQILKVPVSRLSAADQEYLAK